MFTKTSSERFCWINDLRRGRVGFPCRLYASLTGRCKGRKLATCRGRGSAHPSQKMEAICKRSSATDANGHYVCPKLPQTDYEVVLFVNGAIKASINNTKTFADKPTQLDFKLPANMPRIRPRKAPTWCMSIRDWPAIWAVDWVEVDDTTGQTTSATSNMKRLSGEAARRFQTGGTALAAEPPKSKFQKNARPKSGRAFFLHEGVSTLKRCSLLRRAR